MSSVRDLMQGLRPGYSLVVEGVEGEDPHDIVEECRRELETIPASARPRVRIFINAKGRVEAACYADEG